MDKIDCIILTGTANYHAWKKSIKYHLKSKQLWSYVKGRNKTKPTPLVLAEGTSQEQVNNKNKEIQEWEANDEAAVGMIGKTLGPSILGTEEDDDEENEQNRTTAQQLWDSLANLYDTTKNRKIFFIQKVIFNENGKG